MRFVEGKKECPDGLRTLTLRDQPVDALVGVLDGALAVGSAGDAALPAQGRRAVVLPDAEERAPGR